MRPPIRVFLPLLLLVPLVAGCARTVRESTYAPSFTYQERDEVRSTMWQLAGGVRQLNEALRSDERAPEERQAEVVRLLDEIQLAAGRLKGAETSNHPLLEEHLDDFLTDVRNARQAAAGDPPSYFFAGNVTGACMYCHGSHIR